MKLIGTLLAGDGLVSLQSISGKLVTEGCKEEI